jgi:hypothetical protein
MATCSISSSVGGGGGDVAAATAAVAAAAAADDDDDDDDDDGLSPQPPLPRRGRGTVSVILPVSWGTVARAHSFSRKYASSSAVLAWFGARSGLTEAEAQAQAQAQA